MCFLNEVSAYEFHIISIKVPLDSFKLNFLLYSYVQRNYYLASKYLLTHTYIYIRCCYEKNMFIKSLVKPVIIKLKWRELK